MQKHLRAKPTKAPSADGGSSAKSSLASLSAADALDLESTLLDHASLLLQVSDLHAYLDAGRTQYLKAVRSRTPENARACLAFMLTAVDDFLRKTGDEADSGMPHVGTPFQALGDALLGLNGGTAPPLLKNSSVRPGPRATRFSMTVKALAAFTLDCAIELRRDRKQAAAKEIAAVINKSGYRPNKSRPGITPITVIGWREECRSGADVALKKKFKETCIRMRALHGQNWSTAAAKQMTMDAALKYLAEYPKYVL